MSDKQKTLAEEKRIIEQCASSLKSIVGLGLSIEDCRRFVSGVLNKATELYAGRTKESSPVSLEVKTVIDLIKQSIPETTSDTPIYQCGVSDGKRQAIDIILQSQQPVSIAFLSDGKYEQIAKRIVFKEFEGVFDLVGRPYVEHLKAAVDNLNSEDDELRAMQWLHDLLEDIPGWDEERLRKSGLSNRIVNSVIAMTHQPEDTYDRYIVHQVAKNCDAIKGKLADLKHNMDIARFDKLTEPDFVRLQKYLKAYHFLNSLNHD